MRPLFVDLDGTFIKTDTLYESFILAIKKQPLIIFNILLWLLKGRLTLKNNLAKSVDINVSSLPKNQEFYEFLKQEKSKGRKIILATASAKKYSEEIFNEYDLFDDYISSDESINLKSEKKLTKINSISDDFAYAGNSTDDFALFESANEKYLVDPNKSTDIKAKLFSFDQVFKDNISIVKLWIKQLRIYQWLKNILIFVPLLVSGKYLDPNSIIPCIIGFFCFSFLASSTYIINDLFDLESDRSHKRKRFRPLASGNISILQGIIMSLLLLFSAFFGSLLLKDIGFLSILTIYLILTLTYSFKIKKLFGLDVVSLSMLYTLRILAGTAILNLTVSFWLLSFSMFIFFSLALIKRCAEIKNLELSDKKDVKGRDYKTDDYNVMLSLGTSSATMSILMFCFYTNDNILQDQYQEPGLLWLAVPCLGYWLIRMWVKTNRGEMHDDPIIFSLKDKGSVLTIFTVITITLASQLT